MRILSSLKNLRPSLPSGGIGTVVKRVAGTSWAALALLWLQQAFYPDTSGKEARVFWGSYSKVVDEFLKNPINKDWKKPKWSVYSENFIGKMDNMPYEAVPLVKYNAEWKPVDYGWPEEDGSMISLTAMVKDNGLSPHYAHLLYQVALAERNLMNPTVQTIRKIFPEAIERAIGQGKKPSQSAFKVKEWTWDDFHEWDKKKIIRMALETKITPASRDRVVHMWKKWVGTGSLPLWQSLGYKNLIEAEKSVASGGISTKWEAGMAFSLAILRFAQTYIDTGMKHVWAQRNNDGSLTINPVTKRDGEESDFYRNFILPMIKQHGGYDESYSNAANMRDGKRGEYVSFDKLRKESQDELTKAQSTLNNMGIIKGKTRAAKTRALERQKLVKRITQLKNRIASLTHARDRALWEMKSAQSQLTETAEGHTTILRSDIVAVVKALEQLDRAAALYPTNISRAFGLSDKNQHMWTYDQFMINVGLANKSWGAFTSSHPLISVDGDPSNKSLSDKDGNIKFGTATALELLKWNYGNKENYEWALREYLWKIIGSKTKLKAEVLSTGKFSYTADIQKLTSLSFEHKYITALVLSSFLENALPWSELQGSLEKSWTAYVSAPEKQTWLTEIYALISRPQDFARNTGLSLEQVFTFYEKWLLPKLAATTAVLYRTWVVMPEIQKPGWRFDNTSNTLYRATLERNPFSQRVQSQRKTPYHPTTLDWKIALHDK